MTNFFMLKRLIAGFSFVPAFFILLSTLACARANGTTPIPPTQVAIATVTSTITSKLTSTVTRTDTIAPSSTRSPRPTRTPLRVTPVRPTVARTILPIRGIPLETPTQSPFGSSSPPSKPSHVTVARNGDQFTLMVNGHPTYITGMNYNVSYTNLPEDIQFKMQRRDFKIMRDAGVNAIIGWGIYNEITLQVAQEFGIGVIMPFELDPSGSFESEAYRNEIKSNFREYVKRFKDFPAVWGWNPGGDELLYRMRGEEGRTADKLQVACDLEFELAQMAYALDPNHINVIKEPRDWYIKYLNTSLHQAKTQPNYRDVSSSLVYGVNVYGRTDDIQLALGNARLTLTGQLGLAMMVSEFGPFNSQREERPIDYADIWDVVARNSTIGGLVYVFGPDQPNPKVPNPYDPLTLLPSEYSLLDMNGVPVDDSLAALAAKWHAFATPTPTVNP
ncbi:MAG: hypothetical protein HZB51_01440 [Chloroflexi bacterium]|nr:hypothetical protein [Chloroflexota bacterium]